MKISSVIFWSIFVAAAVFRIMSDEAKSPPTIGNCLNSNSEGRGTVIIEPETKGAKQTLTVSADSIVDHDDRSSCATQINIKMVTKTEPRFEIGDYVYFRGKLHVPFNFSGDDPTRKFDYRGYLAKDDIFFEIKSAVVSKVSDAARSKNYFTRLRGALFRIKSKFVKSLYSSLNEPHGALASGLVMGEKASLGKDLLDNMRKVGLIHIVVLSGYNITIVGDAIRRILSFMPRVFGASLGAIGIILFGIMVGGGSTVIRSCFMATIIIIAELIRRDYDVTRALIFAGLIMIIQSPSILLHDPSFQLSFLATLGLILLAKPIETRLSFITDAFGIRGIVASTLATQIFVSPYILYMMGDLSVVGTIVNILVLPIIPLTMLFVSLIGLSSFIHTGLSHYLAWPAHFLLSYELKIVDTFAKLPFSSIHIPAFSFWYVVVFYGVFSVIFFSIKSQFKFSKKSET